MTKYNVLVSQTARKFIEQRPEEVQKYIKERLRRLKKNPFQSRPGANIKRLQGKKRTYYRLKMGDYRAVYIVDELDVKVAFIFPRGKGYSWIE